MAKRSFDIKKEKKAGKDDAPKPRKRRRKRVSEHSSHPILSTRNQKRKLRDRRREAFFAKMWLVLALVVVFFGSVLYLFWQPSVRIQTVTSEGFPDAERVAAIVEEELDGRYYGVFPKDSFFFYPEREIRAAVLDAFPAVSAVSVRRNGFTSLMLEGRPRVPAFWWCGAPESLSAQGNQCFYADGEGLVFLPVIQDASTTPMLPVYAGLDTASTTGTYPLKGRVNGAVHLPDILRFMKTLGSLGVTVASIAIRGDEADIMVAPSTRITYVVGHEKEAEKSARAALPKLSLTDGSIVYVDLRFDGKVYVKRVGE